MTEKLLVPDIGEFENVEIIELLVKEGQDIKKDDPIVTIESDKSSVEIPSTLEGNIKKIEVKLYILILGNLLKKNINFIIKIRKQKLTRRNKLR